MYTISQFPNCLSLQYQLNSRVVMRIFVKMPPDGLISLQVQPSDTILDVKTKIFGQGGYQPKDQTLIYGHRMLQNKNSVYDYGIHKESTLIMTKVLRGGGLPPIRFNSMSKPITLTFSLQAPDWRAVGKGLNLQGMCLNSKCQAFEKRVWVPKGFGKFNITMEVYKSSCPICNQLCQNIQNMGFYQARCYGKGRVKGEKEERNMGSFQTKKDEFLTFEDNDENRLQWLYLEIEVKQLIK